MRRHIPKLLLASAVGAGLAVLYGVVLPALSWDGLNAPILWYGQNLRALSLSGFAGNLGAWALVLLVSALPLFLWKKGGEGRFLVLSSIVLLLGQYFAVNPSQLNTPLRDAYPLIALQTALSLLAAWWVLRWLRSLRERESTRLTGTFRTMFRVCAYLLTAFSAFWTVTDLRTRWLSVAQGNTADPDGLGLTFAVMVLLAVLRFIPDLLAGLTLLLSGELAAELDGGFDTVSVDLCRRVADTCALAARVTVLTAASVNLAQMLFLESLRNSSFSLELPLFTLALSAGLMLLCRILERGKVLQEDSDSII